MSRRVTRRRVLRAGAGGAGMVGLAGCGGLLGGSEGPCGAVESYYTALYAGDAETAAEYHPYEYDPNMTREDAIERSTGWTAETGPLAEHQMEFTCSCTEDVSSEGLANYLGVAGTVTDAVGVNWELRLDLEDGAETITSSELVFEVDGDGWYRIRESLWEHIYEC